MRIRFALLLLAACRVVPQGEHPPDGASQADPQERAGRIAVALQEALKTGTDFPLPKPNASEREAMGRLYRDDPSEPLWIREDGSLGPVARDALKLMDTAEDDGLNASDYGVARLDSLARVVNRETEPAAAARLDVGLSLAAYRYFRDLHVGRVDPRRIGFRMRDPSEGHDFVLLLRTAIENRRLEQAASALSPALPQYQRAREALARYREIESEWPAEVVTLRGSLTPGERSGHLAGLWRRLELLGDVSGRLRSDDSLSAGPIVEGLKRFQARHGIDADGVIGRETLAELNRPLEQRVHQLELLLERLRWLPDLPDGRLVMVNIPMFELSAWDAFGRTDEPTLRTGVIVGKALDTETPVFVEEMRYVIFRPYWNVPSSIVRGEILPALRRDPEYLERQRMEVIEGQSDQAPVVPGSVRNVERVAEEDDYRVRQRPGPGNALGLVKFIFPNDLNVYLHGTPAQELFDRTRRDFSHGCIRLQDPVALAEWILKDKPEWTRGRILDAMERGEDNKRVDLARPLTVILYYTTASVMPDGTVRFARDIYRHDARLDAALHQSIDP